MVPQLDTSYSHIFIKFINNVVKIITNAVKIRQNKYESQMEESPMTHILIQLPGCFLFSHVLVFPEKQEILVL